MMQSPFERTAAKGPPRRSWNRAQRRLFRRGELEATSVGWLTPLRVGTGASAGRTRPQRRMGGVAPAGAARELLRRTFGYPDFRAGQGEVVDHVVDGGDALVLMPTGGGK